MRVSPTLTRTGIYPFARLEEAKRAAAARGVDLIDLGVGDPREQTEEFIQQALVDALPRTSGYPLAQGLPELRGAITRWCARRFGVDLDPDAQVIPTLGSKEAIFSFAQVLVDPEAGRDLVAVTEPGYPVPERGALFAGAEPLLVPLHERNGFLPDLDSIPEETWQRLALFWVNYPNNPTGATAPRELLARLSELARRHDFVLAADEAYSELWYEAPPASVLELGDLRNVVAFNTLSKRSSMTGYRSGFVAGDAQVIGALRTFRPTVGTAPQEFVQRASVAAWDDEAHVERT
ncbi:MAG: aminotransferase class I/II-fold pyridoxal phosphate-dependent enzyme, partial [Actinobacteria bacterium]|nr:aminotransferase class I/II-fold pyridoxal phosphate-dependent enzyme [Actinomycetota bacterium]